MLFSWFVLGPYLAVCWGSFKLRVTSDEIHQNKNINPGYLLSGSRYPHAFLGAHPAVPGELCSAWLRLGVTFIKGAWPLPPVSQASLVILTLGQPHTPLVQSWGKHSLGPSSPPSMGNWAPSRNDFSFYPSQACREEPEPRWVGCPEWLTWVQALLSRIVLECRARRQPRPLERPPGCCLPEQTVRLLGLPVRGSELPTQASSVEKSLQIAGTFCARVGARVPLGGRLPRRRLTGCSPSTPYGPLSPTQQE